ncbi:MAG: SDR family oxidoreductase [Candidatus Binatia bacterium]
MISAERSFDQPEPRACGAPARRLAGRMAVLTGASSGIGRAIAEELAAAGASLCLLGRRPQALRDVAPRRCEGARRMIYQVDLAACAQIENFAASFVRDGGQADILVHSAGVIAIGALEKAPVDDFEWQLNVNVRAPYLLTQSLLPLVKARRGQIVFINSNAGLCAVPGSGQYSATKHALTGLADSLRAEVNGQVRVMSVYTGSTATPMQAALHVSKRRVYAPELLIQPEDVASLVVHALSLPRTVEVTALHMRPGAPSS